MATSASRLYRSAPHLRPPARRAAPALVGHRAVCQDDRWPIIADALAALREAGRYSVRIVDIDCGTGGLLIRAVRHARALGFLAIEGRGIDGAPVLIARAKAAAANLRDPAIGVTFEMADVVTALSDEADLPADIVLCHGIWDDDQPEVQGVIAAAGRCIIADPGSNGIPCRGADA